MKHLLAVALLALVSAPAFAQTLVWTPPHTVDSGWFRPNPNGCEPLVNEPTEWDKLQVPLPPDGADLVRVSIVGCDYRMSASVTNLAAEPLQYAISGIYRYRLGHVPGIYGIPIGNGPGETVYAAGHGWSPLGHLYTMQCAAGGSASYNWVPPATTEESVYTYSGSSQGVEVSLISPEWLVPNRRGAHSLFVTATGEPTWTWYMPGSWEGSHNPWSAGVVEDVRIRVSVEYGSWQ